MSVTRVLQAVQTDKGISEIPSTALVDIQKYRIRRILNIHSAGATSDNCRAGASYVYTMQPCTSFTMSLFEATYVVFMCI